MIAVPQQNVLGLSGERGDAVILPIDSLERILESHSGCLSPKALSRLCRLLAVDPHRVLSRMDLSDCEIDGPTLDLIAQELLPHYQYLSHL